MRKLLSLLIVPLVAAATVVSVGAPAAAHPAKPFPARIALPNGIVALPDGDLLVAQMLSGQLVRVDPRTGGSRLVDLGGYSVERADGLVLRGRTLYVIRNLTNVVAVVRLNAGYTAGVVQREITGPQLRSPATGDLLGSALYVVNGRFDVESTPSTDYDIVRLPA
ncbi:hypothetical protein ACIA47_12600 [Micromonospora sp. NPDC051227]|uniref:hypothetical protein n=1 Tax=Micromonospora sp. NPDC051227 TaxID=3364285 RepID=UPI0037B62642